MSEQNEILTAKDHTIEKSSVTDVPADFLLPIGDERLVIGAKPNTDSEKPESGLEVISLAELPRDAAGNIQYKGFTLRGNVGALLVDPSVSPDFKNGTGFKGLRHGEIVSGDTLATRFGKEAGFNVGLDQDGKIMIENINPDTKTDVLVIKQIEKAAVEDQAVESARKLMGIDAEVAIDSPEAEEELHEEAAEDMGELATESLVEVEEEPVQPEEAEVAAEAGEIAEQLVQVKAEYDRRVGNVLEGIKSEVRGALSGLEKDSQDAANSLRSSLRQVGDAADTMRRIASRIEGENDMSYARRALTDLSGELHSAYGRIGASAERGNDAIRYTERSKKVLDESIGELTVTDKSFEQHVAELVSKETNPGAVETPVFGTKDEVLTLRKSKDELDAVTTALRTSAKVSGDYTVQLRRAIGMVDMMIQEASRGRLDTEELRRIARNIGDLAEDRSGLRGYAAVEEPVGNIKRTISNISQH
jgi:hypothetical protein